MNQKHRLNKIEEAITEKVLIKKSFTFDIPGTDKRSDDEIISSFIKEKGIKPTCIIILPAKVPPDPIGTKKTKSSPKKNGRVFSIMGESISK